jgi:hypothetical protein
MSKYGRLLALSGLVALAPTFGACASVLGIEKAQHDPNLDKAGSGGAGGAEGQANALCGRYCDTVMKNCTGDNPVYRSRTVCEAVCKTLPPGDPGDTDVNTVECRLHFADLAGTVGEPTLNCPAAGPGGDAFCGANCDGFCAIALAACPQSPVSGVGCAKLCQGLPDPGGYTSNIETGDSVECRLYHASAATIDPTTHCRHVAGIAACQKP